MLADNKSLEFCTASNHPLRANEEYQLEHEQFINFIGFAHSHYLYQHGFLDVDKWSRHKQVVEDMIKFNRHSQIMWASKHEFLTPEFQELVDSLISD